ncbi:unnamed protein product [Linum trigynum]|uniref:Uncharacterized protein n=1 Tax=Linum trigynum TaxID=586398 RepID=A0AAV2DDC7_9ROSI
MYYRFQTYDFNSAGIYLASFVQEGAASLDWTNWELHEKPFADSACTVEDRHLLQGELLNEESAIVSSNSSDVHGICCQLITDMTTDCKPDESGLFGAQVMVENVEETGVLQHERGIADCLNGESQVDNRLWTDKYQPKIAREVLSNTEAVNFVNE